MKDNFIVVGQGNAMAPDANEQIFDVYSIVSFPEYNSTHKMNDIALLKVCFDTVII
jgi:hypothetical protein